MNCVNLKIRQKNYKYYGYCTKYKKEVSMYCRECGDIEYKQYKTMKQRTNKQNKKEKERFSIIMPKPEHCPVCGRKQPLTIHEIFAGSNRNNSIKYGLTLYICLNCHMLKQNDKEFNDYWHNVARDKFMDYYDADIEEFIKIFGKSYL